MFRYSLDIGCPETSLNTNQRCLNLQRGEGHICVAAEANNQERRRMFSDFTKNLCTDMYVWKLSILAFSIYGILTYYLLTYLLTYLLPYLLLTYLLTYTIEQSPSWEANRFSASQIPRILRTPKIHYRIHKCPPPFPILSQLDQVHTHTSHLLKILLYIILPSTPGSPNWPLSLRFHHPKPTYASPLPHTHHMPCQFMV